MKAIYILFISLFLSGLAMCQCDGVIVLRTQNDVHAFVATYGNCTEVNTLIIGCDTCDIADLSGLKEVELVRRLELKGGVRAVDGMISLRKVDLLEMEMSTNGLAPFPRLDTIIELDHEYQSPDEDLSIYSEVNYIRTLNLSKSGYFDGLSNFSPHRNFSLNLFAYERGDDLSKIMKGYTGRLGGLALSARNKIGTKYLDLAPLIDIDTIMILGLHRISDIDLSPILDVGHVRRLYISNDADFDLKGGFKNITSLERLFVTRVDQIKTLEDLVPNLRSIQNQVYISYNESIESIELLSDFPPLERTTFINQNEIYISIINNPRLRTCGNNFICNAVKQFKYPDSLRIFLNGDYCTYDSLIQNNCLTLISSDESGVGISVHPNPTHAKVNLSVTDGKYILLGLDGKEVETGTLSRGQIDMSELANGVYVLKVWSGRGYYVEKIVKR